MRKKPDPAVSAIAHRMFDEGIRPSEVCRRAGVSPGTWARWVAGHVPMLPTLRRMEAAMDQLLTEENTDGPTAQE